jgi:hypothetical protein
MKLFDRFSTNPRVIVQLKQASKLTPEQKQGNSIGESRRRLFESERIE